MKFKLDQRVAIAISGEQGTVVGQALYTDDGPRYMVRYKAANGCAEESWWAESALEAIPSTAATSS